MPSRSVLAWLNDPATDSGVRFAQADGSWVHRSYTDLAAESLRVSDGLVSAGIRPGDRVLVVLDTGPDFLSAFYGVLAAGATVSVLTPALPLQGEGHAERAHAVLTGLRPAAVLTGGRPRGPEDLVGGGVPVLVREELAASGGVPGPRPPADLALVQFSSGTGGRPRGVRVSRGALDANVAGIRDWLGTTTADAWASWLPMHHDMGLIGCFVAPVTGGNTAWLLRPAQFVRDPLRWLRCFGEYGATLTATPPFGLDRVLRTVAPDSLAGLDFSGWRAVVVGAEPVPADLLHRFHRRLAPHGLAVGALAPAYGLAEATLAVTGARIGRGWAGSIVARGPLRLGADVGAEARGPVPAPRAGAGERVVVGCGTPLPGLDVRVVDARGASVAEGVLGEIAVRGASLCDGYLEAPGGGEPVVPDDGEPSAGTRRLDGELLTGDSGFLLGGELHVVGRLGDSLKVRGLTVFAEDVELLLQQAGVPAHRTAVALGDLDGTPTAVAVLEDLSPEWLDRARPVVTAACRGASAVVLAAPARTIPRTPSGKTRRRALWRALVDGPLAGRNLPGPGTVRDGAGHDMSRKG